MTFPRVASGSRAGCRQLSLWLLKEDWRVLDAIGRERDLDRGRLPALGDAAEGALAPSSSRD